jgi:hypothetical protein
VQVEGCLSEAGQGQKHKILLKSKLKQKKWLGSGMEGGRVWGSEFNLQYHIKKRNKNKQGL